uniref:Secreted protein n=1 Tax=Triticum urartu TaxID=4572 RepID=A0A8R7PLW1_TRIUA
FFCPQNTPVLVLISICIAVGAAHKSHPRLQTSHRWESRPRFVVSQPRRRPTLTTASHERGRTTPLPRAGVSAATAGDVADHLLVLQSATPFDGGVASVHTGAATGVFGSCKRCSSTMTTSQRAAT